MKSREAFEKWAEYEGYSINRDADGHYLDRLANHAWEGWQAATERAAEVCDEYAGSRWALYKGRPPFDGSEEGRADPHVQGESCGAEDCADLIREGND